MKFKIVTPERVVYEDDNIESVFANAVDGEVGVLPNHIPMVTPLDIGVLRFVKDGQKVPVSVMGGLLRTYGDEVSLLSEAADLSSDIDLVRAQQAKERAEARLRQQTSEVDLFRAKLALSRSIARIKAKEFIR